MSTANQRRDYRRSVEHRIKHQTIAREQASREAEIVTPDEFERDRQLARITISCYGCVPLSDGPHYLRHLGLEDRCFSSADGRRDTMPDIIRRTPR